MKTPLTRSDNRPSDAPLTKTQIAAAQLQGVARDEDRLAPRPMQWVVLMIFAALVGAATGFVGAWFRMCLNWMASERADLILWGHSHGFYWLAWLAPVGLFAAGAAAACALTHRLAPQSAGSGIPRVEAVLRNHLRPATIWMLPVKFIGGALGIGSGLALGREGPTVQMGGTIGRLTGDLFSRFLPEPWTLIAAGAGAGLAVTFNAPLAAVIFVVEELIHRFSARIFSATLTASICGTIVLRWLMGNITDFGGLRLTVLPADVLGGYLLLGVIAGLMGVAYNVSLMSAMRASDRAVYLPAGVKGAIVGGAAGVLAWFMPNLVGGGERLAQMAIMNQFSLLVAIGFLVARFALTMPSYASGAPGGIFAPLLAIGALLGNAFAACESLVLHHPVDPAPYAIVAMAACFTAIVRSPLTGVVLLLEMTGSWPLILPMMAASITAYAIPELLGNAPIYDSLRQRDEEREREGV